MKKYLIVFLISMVPLIELRGAIPYAVGFGLPIVPSIIVAVIGNMLPVPFIFLFARRILEWGKDKKYIGKFFTWCLEKGEKGGKKLEAKADASWRRKPEGAFTSPCSCSWAFRFRARVPGRAPSRRAS